MDVFCDIWQVLRSYIDRAGSIGVLMHDLPQIRGKMLYIPAQGGAMACSRNQHTPAHCGAQGRGEETDSL